VIAEATNGWDALVMVAALLFLPVLILAMGWVDRD
jgi:hypothetical protein